MKKEAAKKIYWGVILILSAVFIVLKSIGVPLGFLGALSVVDLLLSVIILSVTVTSAIKLHFWAIPFELAALFMLNEAEIAAAAGMSSPNLINNWLLLGCAILMSAGLSLIFNPFRKKHFHIYSGHTDKFDTAAEFRDCTGGHSVKLGEKTKYIDCATFDSYFFSVKLGSGELFFNNTETYAGNGTLNVECSMGNMEIHVPAAWNTVVSIESNLGNLEEIGDGTPGGPLLTIQGTNSMGNLEIHHD